MPEREHPWMIQLSMTMLFVAIGKYNPYALALRMVKPDMRI
jgi:hypothetical protein